MKRINILLCTNALYLQHAAVCLTSLLTNNPLLFFNIVVVGQSAEVLDGQRLRRSLMRFTHHSLSFKKFTFPANVTVPLNPSAHYTRDNWIRLWVQDFFSCDVDRVLYLDSDIVVIGDVAPLWNLDLQGALLGAVDIPGSDRGVTSLGLRPEDGYFNSGVLLIDLKQWRQSRALDTLLRYVEAHADLLLDVDQDALNACFSARTKRLDYKWNVIWSFFRDPPLIPLSASEIEGVRREARIIHFNGSKKPWNYFCDHPRRREYDRYLRMTEWRHYVPRDRTVLNVIRKNVSAILPGRIKTLLKSFSSRARGSAF
ncbi:MAG: glycosyltransferase family 8 protein [Acidobacteria bacterium]|nr:glycosyltransferase family 8 protein [Acidobacteriota bacterium]